MHRPNAEEFFLALFETLEDLPPDLAERFAALLKKEHVDRSAAIRQLFEDVTGE
jgi:Ribbon-helix-helix protein, copG family